MITFFACPKPFHSHINVIQRNAIKSWTLLQPRPEIILLGNEEGVAEVCNEFHLNHNTNIKRNEYGTPLINSVFQVGQEKASYPIVCYVNCDIMLMNDFIQVVKIVSTQMAKFLILGQRWDIDIKQAWDFSSNNWEKDLNALLAQTGKLHAQNAMDFFIFPRGMYTDIPPFAIGRLTWDNWLVWRARMNNIPIIDATNSVVIAHQNHEYFPGTFKKSGLKEIDSGFRGKSSKRKKVYDDIFIDLGPEARQNLALVPVEQNLNIKAATWVIDLQGELKRRRFDLKFSFIYYQLKCIFPLYWPAFGRLMRWILNARRVFLRWIHYAYY